MDDKTLPDNLEAEIEPGIPQDLKPDLEPAGPLGTFRFAARL